MENDADAAKCKHAKVVYSCDECCVQECEHGKHIYMCCACTGPGAGICAESAAPVFAAMDKARAAGVLEGIVRKDKAARDQEYAQRQRTHLVQDSSVLPYPTGDLADSPVSSPFGTRAQQLAGLLRFVSTYPKHPIRPEEKDLNLDAAREHVRSTSALATRPPSSSPSSYSGPSRSSSLPADRGPAGLRARTRLWSRQEEEAGARRGEGFSAPVGRRATSGRGGGKQEDVNTPVRV